MDETATKKSVGGRAWKRWAAVGAVVYGGCIATGVLLWRGWEEECYGVVKTPPHLERQLDAFRAEAPLVAGEYERLFAYFVEGFEAYRSPNGGRVRYPGHPSWHGVRVDEIEGVTRLTPLFAAWLAGGRPRHVVLSNGAAVDVLAITKHALTAGTNPEHPDYWGRIGKHDQRVVEAADVALTLWLLKEPLWQTLSAGEKRRLANWLIEVNGEKAYDSNWLLFVVLVNAVLADLGMPHDEATLDSHYQRFKRFYAGDGWFRDGEKGAFDYYNAWGMHYPLYWLQRIRPDYDREFIDGARRSFLATYKYFFTPSGLPIQGRSVCYRMSAIAPLLFGQQTDPDLVAPGEARRALDVTWRYFIRHGAVKEGRITQGYCGDDIRVLDRYSGAASCFWSLRSLVVAFSLPPHERLWQDAPLPLPVEQADFTVAIPSTGWTITGDKASGDVTIHIPNNPYASPPPLHEVTWRQRVKQLRRCAPDRARNWDAAYKQQTYRSSAPFSGCKP